MCVCGVILLGGGVVCTLVDSRSFCCAQSWTYGCAVASASFCLGAIHSATFYQRAIRLRGLCSGLSFEFVGVGSTVGHTVVGVVSSFAHSVGGVGFTVGLSVVWVVLTVVFLLCVRVVSTVSLVVGAPVLMPGWLFSVAGCHTGLVV